MENDENTQDQSTSSAAEAKPEMDWWDATDADLLDLLNRVDQDVIGWRPEPGSKVAGLVTDIQTGESEYGEYPLITIETPAGLIGVHCFHHILRKDIQRRIDAGRLNVGDKIAIAYRGELEASAGKNAPNMYRVTVLQAKQ